MECCCRDPSRCTTTTACEEAKLPPPHVTWRLHCPVSLMIRSFLLNAGFDCKQYCCLKQMMIIIFCRWDELRKWVSTGQGSQPQPLTLRVMISISIIYIYKWAQVELSSVLSRKCALACMLAASGCTNSVEHGELFWGCLFRIIYIYFATI